MELIYFSADSRWYEKGTNRTRKIHYHKDIDKSTRSLPWCKKSTPCWSSFIDPLFVLSSTKQKPFHSKPSQSFILEFVELIALIIHAWMWLSVFQVALRLRRNGYVTGCSAGDTVPYIICCEQVRVLLIYLSFFIWCFPSTPTTSIPIPCVKISPSYGVVGD